MSFRGLGVTCHFEVAEGDREIPRYFSNYEISQSVAAATSFEMTPERRFSSMDCCCNLDFENSLLVIMGPIGTDGGGITGCNLRSLSFSLSVRFSSE